jgi:hypothetical protein
VSPRSVYHNPATDTKVFTPRAFVYRWKRADQPTKPSASTSAGLQFGGWEKSPRGSRNVKCSVRNHSAFRNHDHAVSYVIVFTIHILRFTLRRNHNPSPMRAFLSISAPLMTALRPAGRKRARVRISVVKKIVESLSRITITKILLPGS